MGAAHTQMYKATLDILISFLFLILMGSGWPSYATAQSKTKSPLNAVEMVEIPRLMSPRQSPDGRYIVYLQRSTNWDKDRHVWRYKLYDRQSGDTRDILYTQKSGENFGPVVWAADSRGFLVLLERDQGETGIADQQIHYYDVETGDVERLTSHPKATLSPTWSTDEKQIFFRSNKLSAQKAKSPLDKYRLAIDPYDRPVSRDLWAFDIKENSRRRIIASDGFTVDGFDQASLSNDILYARSPSRLSDDRYKRELYLFDPRTRRHTRLTQNAYSESSAKISPDGKAFAYMATVNAKGEPYYEDNLFVQNVGESKPELLFPETPMEVLDFEWAATGTHLYILGNIGLSNQIYKYDIKAKALTALTKGGHELTRWSYNPATDEHVYVKENAENPGDVFLLDKTGQEIQISHAFKEFNAQKALGEQVAYSWVGHDGVKLEGLLVYPVGYDKAKAAPLITITHGGPRASSQFGSWNVSRAVNVFAGQGYAVFLPNHRGGTGYGDDFMRDMVGGYFNNADDDVMTGINALIDDGIADPNALIKMGWSAGGHMTNWLITQTDRFKAASSGAGASDWVSMYGESDVRYMRTFNFGGSPWEGGAPLDVYQAHSPLYEAHKITTPTLYWVGESDVRVPPTQSILMYRATKAAGAPTELFMADNEPHNFSKPSHQLFKINTELSWFARFLNKTYVPTYPETVDTNNGD